MMKKKIVRVNLSKILGKQKFLKIAKLNGKKGKWLT